MRHAIPLTTTDRLRGARHRRRVFAPALPKGAAAAFTTATRCLTAVAVAADELDRRRKEGATVVETVGAVEEDVAAKEGAAPRERSVSGVASVGGRAGMPACDRDAMLGSPADVCRVVVAREAPPVSM